MHTQLEQAASTISANTSSISALTDERDYSSSQRQRERTDLEQQLTQAVRKITALRGELKHAEQLQVSTLHNKLTTTGSGCIWHLSQRKAVLQLQAEARAQQAGGEASSKAADSSNLAATHQQQLQQLHYELQRAEQATFDAKQESKHAAERHQRQTEAQGQQLSALETQLADAAKQAELHNQNRLEAEQKLLELQEQQQPVMPTISDADTILLKNLRDELASQTADIAEARRFKSHMRYCIPSIGVLHHTMLG